MSVDAPRLRAFRIWSAVHTWTSLISMVFLLMLCLTGLPLVFHEELNDLLGYSAQPRSLPADTPSAPIDRLIAAAQANKPGEVVQFVSFDREEPDVALVILGKTLTSQPPESFVSLDRRTAEVLRQGMPGEGPMGFLLTLHRDMFLGLGGALFLGVMSLLFLVAIVSGIVLYGPFMKKLDFGTVRRRRSTRIKWLDWHNLIGVSTLAWAIVVGATGTINTWADLMLKLWQKGQLAEMTAPYKGLPPPVRLVTLDTAVETARVAAPDMTPRFIAFPGTNFTSAHHYAVFLAGATPVTARLLKPALVDAETGRLTDLRAMPWYVQALFLSQPLHFGDYGGMPLKIAWALIDLATIVLLGSGTYLWFARRRAPGDRAAAKTLAHTQQAEPAE